MDLDSLKLRLIEFINLEVLKGEGDDLDESTPLLELGILDSLSMATLLVFVEESIGVRIPEDEIVPENFESVASIAELVSACAAGDSAESRGLDGEVASRTLTLASGDVVHVAYVEGSDPLWVLLPALGHRAAAWSTMLRTLSGEQRAVALDLTDVASEADARSAVPTYREQLRIVEAYVRELAEPCVLVASSVSGLVALEIARRHPGSVRGVAVSGVGCFDDPRAWWLQFLAASRTPASFIESFYHRAPRLSAAFERELEAALADPAYAAFLDDAAERALREGFSDVRLPVLFVGGEQDAIVPREALEIAAKRVPGARLEWIARCGHLPSLERTESFLWLVREFAAALPPHRAQG
jgi:pimeloyl-ACP methyl ester carboxylesterase/acyl carrier protein